MSQAIQLPFSGRPNGLLDALRLAADRYRVGAQRRAKQRAERAEMARWMADARQDPRLMRELMAALDHHEWAKQPAR